MSARAVASLRVLLAAAGIVVATGGAPAEAQVRAGDLPDRAVAWLQDYIRIDTINPPGNEAAGVQFIAAILDAEGIPYETAESAAGRGNIWARLEGGDEPGLLLLHHIDVVPADPAMWQTDPLSGDIRAGNIYGRGALDTKGLGIVQLAAFIALHRAGVELNRDVVYMATADEEAGGYLGVGWLVDNRPDVFDGIDYVLNEGGSGTVIEDREQFAVEVTQKVPYWLRVTTRGEPGHGSRPLAASSVTRLVAALERLRLHEFEARIIPPVDAYFKGIAASAPAQWRDRYADIASAIREPGVEDELQADDPGMHGLIRNTCSMTRLGGSTKINVVPNEAWAELDCRLLPDQDPEAFLAELGDVLGGEVAVETLMGFTPAVSSSETVLFGTILDVVREHFRTAVVVPSVSTGFTDSHFLRDLGMTAYGFAPFAVPLADRGGVHGNNERLSVENVRRGVVVMLDIVRQLAVD